jgi:hypothetical protein
MADIVLKQCYFCEEWFSPEKVKELSLLRHPSSSYEAVFSCENCLKTSRIERLTAKAAKALEHGGFNEVELTEGDLEIRLVRFTPAPYTAPYP